MIVEYIIHSDILNYTKLAFNSLQMIQNDTVSQPIKQGNTYLISEIIAHARATVVIIANICNIISVAVQSKGGQNEHSNDGDGGRNQRQDERADDLRHAHGIVRCVTRQHHLNVLQTVLFRKTKM